MIKYRERRLDEIFSALSHSTRREIVGLLAEKPYNVGELLPQFDVSGAAISRHIKLLEEAGIVEREIKGRTHVCRLNPRALSEASSWLNAYDKFWNLRADALKRVLEKKVNR